MAKSQIIKIITLLFLFLATADTLAVVNVGDPAPDFTLTDSYGNTFTLSSKLGQTVVLFFLGYS